MNFLIYKRIIAILFISFGIFIFICSLTEEIIEITPALKANVRHIFPEGWAFFTKEPNEIFYECYEISSGKAIKSIRKNCSPENLFGLSRKTRFYAFESGRLIEAIIPSKLWKDTIGVYDGFVPKQYEQVTLKYNLHYFKDGDEVVMIAYKPIPWAYHHRGQEKYRKYQYLKVKLHIDAKI